MKKAVGLKRKGEWRIIKKAILALGLVVSLGMFSAYAESTSSKAVTLKGLSPFVNAEHKSSMEQVMAEFRKKNPTLNVEMEFITENFDEKLLTLFAADTPIDFFWTGISNLGDNIRDKMILPIDQYINGPSSLNLKGLYPAAKIQYGGKTWGIAVGLPIQVAFYNKDMFDEAGIPYPNGGWTWDDLASISATLVKKSGKKVTQYGFMCDEYNRLFASILWSYGGAMFDDVSAPRKTTLNSAAGVKAATYMKKLVQGIGVTPPPGQASALGWREAFQQKMVAITLDHMGLMQTFEGVTGLNFGIAPIPRGDKRTPWCAPDFWVITSKSKNPAQTWEWIKHTSDATGSLIFCGYGSKALCPSWEQSYKDPAWKPNAYMPMMQAGLKDAVVEHSFPGFGNWYWTDLLNSMEEILLTNITPKAALDKLATATDANVLKK